jgi:hypothetical protein
LNLLQFKSLLIVITAVIALIVASPALQQIQVYPQTEFFTELSLTGPEHTAENYPYTILRYNNYIVFLDITNHLGSCAYYQVQVKFRNETQSTPNGINRTYSTLPSLYNVSAFVADKESWELPVALSFDYSFVGATRIVFSNLRFNGVNLNLTGITSDWDPTKSVYYGNLIFELWIYNGTTNTFQYHERFVSLLLNMGK